MLKNSPGLSTSKGSELHFKADHFKSLELHFEVNHFKSGTPFQGGPLSPEETDLGISKAQNSNSKQTEVQTKPRLYSKMKDILKTRKPEVLLTPISKVHDWIPKRNFEGLEPFLRQTNYLKAHNFPDANKRWGRIKVRNSKRKVEKQQREEPPKQDFKVGSKKLKLFVGIEPTGTISKPLTT
ncbi:hypothetical protein RclHR1_00080027 [Rhizophagus clarus]|uniref:Uncharacterized protein n=1 Tax=Rhizophagus clarus TaxID=94130 RepID=A0A2Z6SE01_9GLOM|nr:hypothetical protein RclHR1_00080027 [Rhizophagus clarus]